MDDERPTVTTTITDADRETAERTLRPFGPHARMSAEAIEQVERVAEALAQARAEGHAAGLAELERASDAAHLAGYAEGRAELHDVEQHAAMLRDGIASLAELREP